MEGKGDSGIKQSPPVPSNKFVRTRTCGGLIKLPAKRKSIYDQWKEAIVINATTVFYTLRVNRSSLMTV